MTGWVLIIATFDERLWNADDDYFEILGRVTG
jgi:hypothetical protein